MSRQRVLIGVAVAALAGSMFGISAMSIVSGDQAGSQSRNTRRVIRPEKAPNTGLPFSPGILVGNTLYIAGHLGRDPVTSKLVTGGIEAETRQSLANIRAVLQGSPADSAAAKATLGPQGTVENPDAGMNGEDE